MLTYAIYIRRGEILSQLILESLAHEGCQLGYQSEKQKTLENPENKKKPSARK